MRFRFDVSVRDIRGVNRRADSHIYCSPKLASKLNLRGVGAIHSFVESHIRHEYNYYHGVVIIDELCGFRSDYRNVFEDIFGVGGENMWRRRNVFDTRQQI